METENQERTLVKIQRSVLISNFFPSCSFLRIHIDQELPPLLHPNVPMFLKDNGQFSVLMLVDLKDICRDFSVSSPWILASWTARYHSFLIFLAHISYHFFWFILTLLVYLQFPDFYSFKCLTVQSSNLSCLHLPILRYFIPSLSFEYYLYA